MDTNAQGKASTGVSGLDDVLGGGLPRDGLYLLQGAPGAGKTTLALQFLLQGRDRSETCLYAALTETEAEVRSVARSHGWNLDGLVIWDLGAAARRGTRKADQTMFLPAEVELEETTRPMFEEIDRVKPDRVVIDSLSEMRLLAREPLRYRRQLLALKQFFLDRHCTALLIDTTTAAGKDAGGILETLIGGLIVLEKTTPVYGSSRRRLLVDKMRGVGFREGYHDFAIKTGGVAVYPRLVAAEHSDAAPREHISSGVDELDALLGGGIERGTSTLLLGAAGTGKSTLATQYAMSVASRGERAVIFTFEESVATWVTRSTALGFDVQPYLADQRLRVIPVDPAELSPGELSMRVRHSVEVEGASLLVIDSLNGYLHSVPEESFLLLHLHELLTYLGHKGVATIMNMAQHGLLGPAMHAPVDVSYLADCVLLLRYFEARGSVRQALSVVKKRSGVHERTIREFALDRGGVRVGQPLRDFHGVLTGVPTYQGSTAPLLEEPQV